MNVAPLSVRFLTLCIFLLLFGCGKSPAPSQMPAQGQQSPGCEQERQLPSAENEAGPGQIEHAGTCADARSIQESERNRAHCYRLQPAPIVHHKKSHRAAGHTAIAGKGKGKHPTGAVGKAKQKKGRKTGAAKTLTAKKKGKHKIGPTTVAAPNEEERTTGMCQPQSLIYARCRTGIKTCTMGNTSPVQWFACARRNGSTTLIPTAGSVLVLDGNSRRRMTTGHPVYVEAVKANPNGTWTLRITHTNYDRKCHLDLDATVLFDPKRLTASFQSGPWASWAQDLKVLGFILQ